MAMKVTRLQDAEPRPRRLAIGTFDGVHLGHQAVIAGADTVLTFDPHPLSVLAPERAPKLITSFEVRRDLIAGLGVAELVVIPFNPEFAQLSAEEFISHVLIEKLDARKISIGENFNFGAKARGTPEMLSLQPEFTTRVVSMIEIDGETVSSGRVRGLIEEGDVTEARRCLGAPFMVEGEVVRGEQRGRELGFPTANIVPDPALVVPGHGVYATFASGAPSATNVGTRPTFESELGLLVETYLIDRSEDLYGQNLRVAFVERLRGEERFESAEALIEQMHRDVEDSRRICSRFGGGAKP
jgi:riboflavin kinase/FMN adenylyltransferase